MSSNNNEENEDINIELLIDKKIAETKVLITEKRLNFFMALGAALLTIFGIILPIFLTQESTNRVDQAIDRMDAKIAEFTGKQLRKAKIATFVDGRPLENAIINFDPDNRGKNIIVKNIGDGTADYIRMRLYHNTKDKDFVHDISGYGYYEYSASDKPGFTYMVIFKDEINLLPAQDSFPINIVMQNPQTRKEDLNVSLILVIFYGEPTPIEIPFSIKINKDKS